MHSSFMIPMDSRLDLTSEILEEKGLTYDEEGFESAGRTACKVRRSIRKTQTIWVKMPSVYDELDAEITEFVGYDQLEFDSKISATDYSEMKL